MWQAVDAIYLKFEKVLSGTVSTPPRWRKCLEDANCKKYIFNSYSAPGANNATAIIWRSVPTSLCISLICRVWLQYPPKSAVLPQLIGSMYVKKHFDMNSRTVAEEMVFDLRWLNKYRNSCTIQLHHPWPSYKEGLICHWIFSQTNLWQQLA